jgi:uncharacterized SAM-binding protein YcdF (DUF218 family)
MFIAAKFLAFLTQPLAWVAVLMGLAVLAVRRRPRLAQRLGATAVLLLVALGWEPLPDAVLRQLESQYPPVAMQTNLSAYRGVIVLGGALEPAYVWHVRDQSALNDAAERLTEVLPLLKRQPHLHLLFTGGEGELFTNDLTEAERAKRFFIAQGVAPTQLLLESSSRTTFENAVFSKALPGVDATRPWLLVTSAWHMPRAMAAFERAGWLVTAYPVDFRAGHATPWTQYSMDLGDKKWRIALHEWIGLWIYRLTGRA